jgi:transcriptional repressor of dcmA and dcmR
MTGDSDDFLDIKQAAKLLNVSETSLRRWTNSGALMAYRIGRRRERRFRRSDLFAFIAAPSGNAKDGREQHITKGASESSPAQSTRNHGNHFCGAYGSEASAARLAAAFLADDDSRDVV